MQQEERYAEAEPAQHTWEPARVFSRLPSFGRSEVERRNTILAYVLLAAGLALLSGRFGLFGIADVAIMPGLILATIAGCFLYFAFWQRWYAMLIPGCVLAGLAIGVPLASLTGGVSVLWGLALGFAAIHKLGSVYFGVRHRWAIFPAIPLFAVGVIVAIAQLGGLLAAGASLWVPLLLIGAGLVYMYRNRA